MNLNAENSCSVSFQVISNSSFLIYFNQAIRILSLCGSTFTIGLNTVFAGTESGYFKRKISTIARTEFSYYRFMKKKKKKS